jgi:Family of unknown function (DUF5994)
MRFLRRPIRGPIASNCEGWPMNCADPLDGTVAPQQNPIADVIIDSLEKRCEGTTDPAAEPTSRMTSTPATRQLVTPVRLTLASRLGDQIDGAWWPRTGLISRELPELIAALDVRLGRVIDISVNWSSLQRPPDLNSDGWRGIHQHVMTVGSRKARANLLIVPYRTGTALAVMILRRAAGAPRLPSFSGCRQHCPRGPRRGCLTRVIQLPSDT